MSQHRPLTTPAQNAEITLSVEGMTCASCVGRVERAIRAVPGVTDATVNLTTEKAQVTLTSPDLAGDVVSAVEKAGYGVEPADMDLAIEGMNCASCVGSVEKALSAVPGVTNVTVNLATERAHIQSAWPVPFATLQNAVAKAGYDARQSADDERKSQTAEKREAERKILKRDAIIAGVLTLPIFLVEMGGHAFPTLHHWLYGLVGQDAVRIAEFLLTAAVLAGPGRRFFRIGIPALLRGAPEMNALVAIGAGAAFLFSTIATFLPTLLPEGADQVYFEAAAVIATLILIGRMMEAKAKGRASAAINKLVGLQPRTARRRLADGSTEDVAIATLNIGDVVEIRPGERVPVDGIVRDGASRIDESMLSGEAIPVEKSKDAEVIGGTVNQTGHLIVEVTATGSDSVLAGIVAMVERAQSGKLPIQALVDKVTMRFVPAVILVACVTVGIWLAFGPEPRLAHALVAGVAVLITACPCAMGLATPTSILVGSGRAAELGILFRKSEAMQRLAGINAVAFDKTGTLTEGRPSLTDIHPCNGISASRALAIAAALEAKSEHPLAAAILQAAKERDLTLPEIADFDAVPGFGITARLDDKPVVIGTARLMAQHGIAIDQEQELLAELADQGKSPILLACDGQLIAILAVADRLREGSRRAVASLRDQGIAVAMVTGDSERVARAVAKELGIEHVLAEVTPADKQDAVRQIRERHGQIAFVGDGINDAPALAEADVGIAIGTGTDIAIEAADLVLMAGDPRGAGRAIALSRAVMRNIRQNLFWAFAYNAALIPVAAGAFYPTTGLLLSPMLAAGAMALSSIFVLSNALRLKRFQA